MVERCNYVSATTIRDGTVKNNCKNAAGNDNRNNG